MCLDMSKGAYIYTLQWVRHTNGTNFIVKRYPWAWKRFDSYYNRDRYCSYDLRWREPQN